MKTSLNLGTGGRRRGELREWPINWGTANKGHTPRNHAKNK